MALNTSKCNQPIMPMPLPFKGLIKYETILWQAIQQDDVLYAPEQTTPELAALIVVAVINRVSVEFRVEPEVVEISTNCAVQELTKLSHTGNLWSQQTYTSNSSRTSLLTHTVRIIGGWGVGRAPSEVQGQSIWPVGQGAKLLWSWTPFAYSQPEESANLSWKLFFLQNKISSHVWEATSPWPLDLPVYIT